ncbi:50S ribosomal protein L3 [Candidatus Parcubacteria bacterium]|nr:50S ribosomal protein L3 [Candidatus Parcubacteria bacterium]
MKFILGKKLNMTQIFKGDAVIAATVIKVGECKITQVKYKEKDGYQAAQIGFGSKKKINKPLAGALKGLGNFRWLKEFRDDIAEKFDFKKGDILDIESFEVGDKVIATAVSKGKGFQGVVKRWGFHGQDKTHGTKDQLRMPGSIGATGPAHVFKGTKMGGQMGNKQVSVSNLEIIEVDKEKNLIKVKGAVPGHRNSLVSIKAKGDMKVKKVEEIKSRIKKKEKE